jgi:hypothetical protein
MTNSASTEFTIDRQGFYPLTCRYDRAQQQLTVQFDHDKLQIATPRFRYNLFKRLTVNGTEGAADKTTSTLTFQNVSELPLTLAIAGRHIATLDVNDGALGAKDIIPLSVSHKRIIGTYHAATLDKFALGQTETPAQFARQLAEAEGAILGDFHTHSSGNISAKALLEVAIRHDARYPLHLLEEIGIKIPEDRLNGNVEQAPRIKFPPMEPQNLPGEVETLPLTLLTDEERLKLERSMAIKDTEVQTFTETEIPAYQLRYPLTKNPALLKELIREMVRENQRAGIQTIDLSYVGLEDPAIFRAVHEVLDDLPNHDDTKQVRVFLKYGIPRTHDIKKIEELLEKAKIIAQSPYVTCIDFLGYEDNKTGEFSKDVRTFAAWAKQHAPGLMIAVHAGENDKNRNNVKDALALARDTGMPVRIGHGLYGLDEEAIAMAKEILAKDPVGVVFEFNPESNIALNNIMDARGLPYPALIDSGIPFVPGSDSFGQYQSSKTDLAQTFIDAGFTSAHFAKMKEYQEGLTRRLGDKYESSKRMISNQTDYLNRACQELQKNSPASTRPPLAINNDSIRNYLESQDVKLIEQAINHPPEPEAKKSINLPPELQDKKAITIIGASGTNWKRIDPGHQREIAIACDMLAHALDPEQVFFAQGRNKNFGLSEVLNEAIDSAKSETGTGFNKLGFQADIDMSETEFPYGHLTHMIALPKRTAIPGTLADFTTEHDGIMIAMGGAAYTRDALLKADLRSHEQEKGFVYTMEGPVGASNDKARGMGKEYVFTNGKELLQQIYTAHKDYFRPGIDCSNPETVEKLYQNALDQIGDRYGAPSTKGQRVEGINTPNPRMSKVGK